MFPVNSQVSIAHPQKGVEGKQGGELCVLSITSHRGSCWCGAPLASNIEASMSQMS